MVLRLVIPVLAVVSLAAITLPEARADVVSEADTKRFLDPTVMISKVEYRFQANYLPDDLELYTNKIRPWLALNNDNAVWVEIPHLRYSMPDGSRMGGIGDLTFGWGRVIHENLGRKLTASAFAVELVAPTGEFSEGTGFDAYMGSVAGMLVVNPTDLFPVFVVGRYRHSFDETASRTDIRTAELTLRTFHILPSGFFLLLIPSFLYDFAHEFDVFSFGIGAGRALTKHFAVQGAYVQHISGQKTFNRGFTVGLNYLWGENKGR